MTAYAVPEEFSSPVWARSFAAGCGGSICKQDVLQPGDVAMFGSPARWSILRQAQAQGRTWYYGDHAYFSRHRFFRVTRNAYQVYDLSGEGDPKRFEYLSLSIDDWKRRGEHILLCPNSPTFFGLHGQDCDRWIEDTTRELRKHTDREIRVRFKRSPVQFEIDLSRAWAVVVYTSVCGVHAAMAGVPCFATERCASQAFGTSDLSLIETPVRPDNRYEMACVLAANQWTPREMSRGRAWSYLNEQKAVAGLDLP